MRNFRNAPSMLPLTALAGLALAFLPAPVLGQAPPTPYRCGPGLHWVDECPAGIDRMIAIGEIGLDVDLDSVVDFSFATRDRTWVRTGDPVDAILGDPFFGDVGTVDGHFDVIPTELFFLRFAVDAGSLGIFRVRGGDGIGNLMADGPLYSPGFIHELPGNPLLALSVFDVFFEVLNTPWGVLRNRDSKFVEARCVDMLPPLGCEYVSGKTPLYDETGVRRLDITFRHTPVAVVPEPLSVLLLGTGLFGVGVVTTVRRRKGD